MKNEKHRQLPRKPTEQYTTVICYNYTNTQTHVVPKHDCPVRSCSFVETMCTFVSASSLLMTTLSGLRVSESVCLCVGMCDETRRLMLCICCLLLSSYVFSLNIKRGHKKLSMRMDNLTNVRTYVGTNKETTHIVY